MEILYFEKKKKLFEETFCQVHFSVPSVGCDGRHTIDVDTLDVIIEYSAKFLDRNKLEHKYRHRQYIVTNFRSSGFRPTH